MRICLQPWHPRLQLDSICLATFRPLRLLFYTADSALRASRCRRAMEGAASEACRAVVQAAPDIARRCAAIVTSSTAPLPTRLTSAAADLAVVLTGSLAQIAASNPAEPGAGDAAQPRSPRASISHDTAASLAVSVSLDASAPASPSAPDRPLPARAEQLAATGSAPALAELRQSCWAALLATSAALDHTLASVGAWLANMPGTGAPASGAPAAVSVTPLPPLASQLVRVLQRHTTAAFISAAQRATGAPESCDASTARVNDADAPCPASAADAWAFVSPLLLLQPGPWRPLLEDRQRRWRACLEAAGSSVAWPASGGAAASGRRSSDGGSSTADSSSVDSSGTALAAFALHTAMRDASCGATMLRHSPAWVSLLLGSGGGALGREAAAHVLTHLLVALGRAAAPTAGAAADAEVAAADNDASSPAGRALEPLLFALVGAYDDPAQLSHDFFELCLIAMHCCDALRRQLSSAVLARTGSPIARVRQNACSFLEYLSHIAGGSADWGHDSLHVGLEPLLLRLEADAVFKHAFAELLQAAGVAAEGAPDAASYRLQAFQRISCFMPPVYLVELLTEAAASVAAGAASGQAAASATAPGDASFPQRLLQHALSHHEHKISLLLHALTCISSHAASNDDAAAAVAAPRCAAEDAFQFLSRAIAGFASCLGHGPDWEDFVGTLLHQFVCCAPGSSGFVRLLSSLAPLLVPPHSAAVLRAVRAYMADTDADAAPLSATAAAAAAAATPEAGATGRRNAVGASAAAAQPGVPAGAEAVLYRQLAPLLALRVLPLAALDDDACGPLYGASTNAAAGSASAEESTAAPPAPVSSLAAQPEPQPQRCIMDMLLETAADSQQPEVLRKLAAELMGRLAPGRLLPALGQAMPCTAAGGSLTAFRAQVRLSHLLVACRIVGDGCCRGRESLTWHRGSSSQLPNHFSRCRCFHCATASPSEVLQLCSSCRSGGAARPPFSRHCWRH